MRKLLILACLVVGVSIQAQDSNSKYEKAGDLVKVTRFYEDGTVKEQGFYKDKMLTGMWTTYDSKGNKTAIAHYEAGKKVGKWFMWQDSALKEIDYRNNSIVNVQSWKEDTQLATK